MTRSVVHFTTDYIIWKKCCRVNTFDKNLNFITSALRSVSGEAFDTLLEDCLRTIDSRGKLVVSGLGKNVSICEKFVGTLNSLGIPAAFMHTNTAAHGDLGLVAKGDLVILLTKSGETQESVHLSELLQKRECKIWLLSFSSDSTLHRQLSNHLIIRLEHEGDEWNIVPNNSTVINLIILQELAIRIAREKGVTLEDFRKNHPGGAIGTMPEGSPK